MFYAGQFMCDNSTKSMNMIYLIFLLMLFLVSPRHADAQQVKNHTEKALFQDEYAELDDEGDNEIIEDAFVLQTLKKSKQKHLKALILIERGDTTAAAKYFNQAIEDLNIIASYPNIEKNENFTDLAQLIIEDYENFVDNIDDLDAGSNIFIIREKLFQEIDTYEIIDIDKFQAQAGVEAENKPGFVLPPDSLEIPMPINDYVKRNIAFWTNPKRGEKLFYKILSRSSKYLPMIMNIAEEEGVPKEIAYLSITESALRPDAVSRAKAVGLWQFMRATGEMYGLNDSEDSYWVDERRDPEKATRAAMRHLKDLYVRFGDWHLAFAAYNCGPGCVSRAIRRSRKSNPTFWELTNYLPKETKYYVPWYIATSMIAMNPEAYGFNLDSVDFQPEYKYDVFKLHEPVNIAALAKCANVSIEEIKSLNPELIKATTPPDLPEYDLRIPPNTYAEFAIRFDSLTIQDKQPWFEHIVKRRESLRSLAKKYKVSRYDIAELNNITPRSRLKRDQSIKIPINLEVDMDELAAVSGVSGDGVDIYHYVKRGETLSSIARKHGLGITTLRNLNNISYSNDRIHPGQRLVIAKAPPKRKKAKKQDDVDLAEVKRKKEQQRAIEAQKAAEEQLAEAGEEENNEATEENIEVEDDNQELAANNDADQDDDAVDEDDDDTEEEDNTTEVEQIAQPVIVKHTVKSGESLYSISKLYDVPVEVITSDNRIRKNQIYPNQILKIRTNADDMANVSTKSKSEAAKPKMIIHKVRNGQSLGLIAQRYGVRSSQIRQWNPGKVSGNTIYSGSRLKIYPNDTYKGSTTSSKTPIYYQVRKYDTLQKIARKYGVSINHLKKLNRNLNPRRMQIGDKIRVQ